jgi:hypothetical protein
LWTSAAIETTMLTSRISAGSSGGSSPARRAATIDLPARRADEQQIVAAGGGDLGEGGADLRTAERDRRNWLANRARTAAPSGDGFNLATATKNVSVQICGTLTLAL